MQRVVQASLAILAVVPIVCPPANGQSLNHSQSSSWSSSSSISRNETTNGHTTAGGIDHRYSTRSINGVNTKLTAPNTVIFKSGKPVRWAADSVIKLSESRFGFDKVGELRAQGKQLKVWIKNGNSFKPGTAADQVWADNLVTTFNLDDTPPSEKKAEAAKYKMDDPRFTKALSSLQYNKDKTELAMQKAKSPSLSSKEQIALIDLIFDKIDYDRDRKAILLELIHRKDFSKDAGAHLVDNIERLSYQADRKLILKELFNRN